MKLLEYLVCRMKSAGVTHVFAVGGGAVLPLHMTLATHFTVINAANEAGAVFMADGYARATRRIGVALVTTGPGTTNACTAIASAHSDFIPVVLLSGQTSTTTFGLGGFQESSHHGIDTVAIYSHLTKLSTMLDSAHAIQQIDDAFAMAMEIPQGPVHISIPSNLQIATIDESLPRNLPDAGTLTRNVGESSLAKAIEIISMADRIAILAGYGVRRSQAEDQLVMLAGKLDSSVYVTPKSVSAMRSDHPLYGGMYGFPGNSTALASLNDNSVSTVLIVGSRLGEWSSCFWDDRLWRGRKCIAIDVREPSLPGLFVPDVWLRGDIRQILTTLAQRLASRTAPTHEQRSRVGGVLSSRDKDRYDDMGVNPAHVVDVLNSDLPESAQFFVDIGNSMLWALPHLVVRQINSVHVALGFGAMGSAVAGSLGLAVAKPELTTIALVGDGAFLMLGGEVRTAVEHNIPVVWIVMNDGGFRMLEQVEVLIYGRSVTSSTFKRLVDVAALAVAYGADAQIVTHDYEFADALRAAIAARGPFVIDVRIDGTITPESLFQRAKHLEQDVASRSL